MVKETKIVFELSELTAVRLQCVNCGWELVWPTDKDPRNIPANCPSCTKAWDERTPGRALADAVQKLLCEVRTISDTKIKIRLEMNDSDGD